MKIIDVIFALICGRVVGFVVSDFLEELKVSTTAGQDIIIWLAFPLLALVCLWIANAIGRKFLFVFQVAKHILVGTFATVIDLKLFEILLAGIFLTNPLISKSISFLFSTTLKYIGNKYWTFKKHEKEGMHKEIAQFFLIMLVGLAIDVSVFYCATKIIGPQFGISIIIWTKLSVIFAALVAAIWNFTGDKFIVFKK
ncbi:MAG: GtrA family protein [Candidatus Staskawiczbacteria bacterium]|nr:GtrA family protein [Candidatus Staskawiczbacteria bacterium]